MILNKLMKGNERQNDYQLTRDRVRRIIKSLERYGFADEIAFGFGAASEVIHHEPETYQKATNCTNKDMWQVAVQEELNLLLKNKTWVLVKK